MERILVIGSNGAGKSTFSVALAQKTGFPLTHIDKLYWRDNWEITPKDEFESAVMRIAQGDKWIIEGKEYGATAGVCGHSILVLVSSC